MRRSSVQFYPRWYYALGKAPNYALHPVSQTFPQRRLRNGSNVRLTDDGPFSSFQGRSPSASSFHAFLLQPIKSVMSLALYAQVVSQAPQHFRSSKQQAISEGCFAPPIWSVISLHSGMSRVVHPQEFSKVVESTSSSEYSYQEHPLTSLTELRSCVKVQVAVLGSPSLIVFLVSVDIKSELQGRSRAAHP